MGKKEAEALAKLSALMHLGEACKPGDRVTRAPLWTWIGVAIFAAVTLGQLIACVLAIWGAP